MIYVYKKSEKDTPEDMVKRFTRKVQQSGLLKEVRKNKFEQKRRTKEERRKEALYKRRIHQKIERLKKLGHFNEDALKELKKRMRLER